MAKFVPKRGQSTRLNDLTLEDGQFIITSDDGKIYTDLYVNGTLTRVPVGGAGSGGGGLDFSALSDALTGGTLTNITIVPDAQTQTFDIAVAEPSVEIDSNGYWVINGVTTSNYSKGDNGITPSIDSTSKHWMIGSTDTGIVAEGQTGPAGTTPSIDSITKHWMIGSTDTNVIAEGQDGVSPSVSIDETSSTITISITDSSSTQTATINKTITDVDIINGRVNTVADLANISSPTEGMIYLVGATTDTFLDKYIYIDRDNIQRWEFIGKNFTSQIIDTQEIIAPIFDSSESYAVDDFVIYDDVLYKCNTAHTGVWDSIHFTQTNIVSEMGNGGGDLSNYYTKTEIDSALLLKANTADVYTKTQSDNTFVAKSDIDIKTAPTTSEINAAIADIWGA